MTTIHTWPYSPLYQDLDRSITTGGLFGVVLREWEASFFPVLPLGVVRMLRSAPAWLGVRSCVPDGIPILGPITPPPRGKASLLRFKTWIWRCWLRMSFWIRCSRCISISRCCSIWNTVDELVTRDLCKDVRQQEMKWGYLAVKIDVPI